MHKRMLGMVVGVLAVLGTACGSDPATGVASDGGKAGDAKHAAADSGDIDPGSDSGDTPTMDGGMQNTEDAASAPFTLTSTALAEGATFAKDNTCDGTDSS